MKRTKRSLSQLMGKSKVFSKKGSILIIIVPLVVLLALFVPILLNLLSGGTAADQTPAPTGNHSSPVMGDADPNDSPTVEILPETERPQPEKDPFVLSGTLVGTKTLRLAGILSGANGLSTAIIHDGQTSYILGLQDYIGETEWYISEITAESAILSDGDQQVTLILADDAK